RRHPERVAVAGEPREVTYGELAALANRAGNALLRQGVRRGERVLIVLPDSPEFIAVFFGAAKIGAVAVPVNPFARSADYAHYLGNCEPRVAVVHVEALPEFSAAAGQRSQFLQVVVGRGKHAARGAGSSEWKAWTGAASSQLAPADTSLSDPAFM